LEFQSELGSDSPSKNLRKAFQNHGIVLSSYAAISVLKKDRRWRVTGENKQTYMIRQEAGQLNVYIQEPGGKQNFRNWAVLVSQPASVAFQDVTQLTNKILTFTLISCLVVIPIALVVAQRIVTPIMQVANAARAIGHGEFDQEIPVTSRNEVGILAEEFNSMRRNLKNAVGNLIKEEKKMTAIVNSLAEGLVLVDQNNRVLHINPTAEYLLNISANQIGSDFAQVIQNPELTKIFKESQAQISLNKTVTFEVVLNRDGKKLVLRVVACPFLDENGFALGTVYVFDDMTREKEIDRMKSDFINLVSHELRTPLTSIIGFVSLILDGKTGAINEKQKDSLNRVQRQSKRLAALITDLLDISRIESGRIQMKQEPISLMEVATQRIEEIRPQADAKSIRLSLIAPERLPQMIGDEERIGQVFTNLIGNAIKFTPEQGEVVVKIKVDGNLLHVEVIDTGPGIPIEERQKVFDKFYQLSDVHTRPQGGSGLGLAITKGIIEEHGGTLWVDDGDHGIGSNFQFVLPLTSFPQNEERET
jgi:PAS domain S-box-containing protein